MKRMISRVMLVACAGLTLAGCSGDDDKERLPGERLSILELQRRIAPETVTPDTSWVAPAPWQNEFWPQAGGYPNHSMQNLSFTSEAPRLMWSVSIGEGSTKKLPLMAQPVMAEGRIFTLDSRSALRAFSVQDGTLLWQVDVRDQKEDDPVLGGGLAYARGVLYVTTGYDEVLAITADAGGLVWRVDIPAPARAAPAVIDGRVFVTTLDNRLLALSTEDGRNLWDYTGVAQSAGLVGAASPAAGRDIIVPAFSSGEIYALRMENGAMAWSENLSSFGASASGLGSLTDIRGLPVLDNGLVIAISFGGRMAAINERTGERVWQRDIGSAETPWVAGNRIFVVSNENELIALNRETGTVSWVKELPRYGNPEKRKDPISWTGPVMAGGRLIIAGTNGDVVEITAEEGQILRNWSVGEPVTIDPLVAGGVLYILADNGTLMAFR